MLQVSTQQATEGELSVSIMDQIRANQGHADYFDVESLLVAVKNILNGASLVDNALVIYIGTFIIVKDINNLN